MLILLVLLVLLILAAAAVLSIIRRQEPGIHVDNSTLHSENISMDKLNSPNAILTELKSGETIAQRGGRGPDLSGITDQDYDRFSSD